MCSRAFDRFIYIYIYFFFLGGGYFFQSIYFFTVCGVLAFCWLLASSGFWLLVAFGFRGLWLWEAFSFWWLWLLASGGLACVGFSWLRLASVGFSWLHSLIWG